MPADKPKPDFSNVRSGGSSTTPAATPSKPPFTSTPASTPTSGPASTPTSAPAPRTYTVVAGDSLSKIAKKLYGDGAKWKRIFEANRDIIKNPDLIRPGQVLKIPEA